MGKKLDFASNVKFHFLHLRTSLNIPATHSTQMQLIKKNEKNHDVSKNEFDAIMSPVESKPVTTFKKLYECHRKKFPKVRVSNSNMEFKKTAAICLQELLGMNDQDIFENKKFWNRINNYVTRFPKMYKKHHYKNMFHAYKDFFETEISIPPTNNSKPTQSNQNAIVEEIEENSELSDNEFDLDMSCDEIRPHTSFKKLFEYHRSRFPNVGVCRNYNEFKETSAICLQELLRLKEMDILDNKQFWSEINNFAKHVPKHYES